MIIIKWNKVPLTEEMEVFLEEDKISLGLEFKLLINLHQLLKTLQYIKTLKTISNLRVI